MKAQVIIESIDEIRMSRTREELGNMAAEIVALHRSSPHVSLEATTRDYADGVQVDFDELFDIVQALAAEEGKR